jgi:hypothetical protein
MVCGLVWLQEKEMCLEEIGLRAQNLTSIIGSIMNVIGGGGPL